MASEKQIKEFCKKFYAGLDKDGWGDIDPWLFKYIADGDSEDEDTDDITLEALESLKKILKESL